MGLEREETINAGLRVGRNELNDRPWRITDNTNKAITTVSKAHSRTRQATKTDAYVSPESVSISTLLTSWYHPSCVILSHLTSFPNLQTSPPTDKLLVSQEDSQDVRSRTFEGFLDVAKASGLEWSNEESDSGMTWAHRTGGNKWVEERGDGGVERW